MDKNQCRVIGKKDSLNFSQKSSSKKTFKERRTKSHIHIRKNNLWEGCQKEYKSRALAIELLINRLCFRSLKGSRYDGIIV